MEKQNHEKVDKKCVHHVNLSICAYHSQSSL